MPPAVRPPTPPCPGARLPARPDVASPSWAALGRRPSARGGSSGANAKVVDVLREMAQLLRAKGEGFRANALAKAAKAIEDHVDELKSAKEATKLQGVGKGTGAILEEVRSTGKCAALEELKRESQNDGEAQPDSEPKVVWYHCV
mmetsp:Transcript_24778/g.58990  ORF Transcript_24778/g.58990 Transcript_24778/m.58990 type:complete len:145 (+) Transcript_24778:1102-1536(+)